MCREDDDECSFRCCRTTVITTIAATLSLADVVTDALLFIKWITFGQFGWAFLGLGFVFVSHTLLACVVGFDEEEIIWACLACCGCFSLYIMYQLFCNGDNSDLDEHMDDVTQTKAAYKMIEVLESVPSTALQLYIILGKTMQIEDIIAPFRRNGEGSGIPFLDIVSISLSYGMSTRHLSRVLAVLAKETEQEGHWYDPILMYPWIAMEIFHRQVSIILTWFVLGRVVAGSLIGALMIVYWIVGCGGVRVFTGGPTALVMGFLNILSALAPSPGFEVVSLFLKNPDEEDMDGWYVSLTTGASTMIIRQLLDIALCGAAFALVNKGNGFTIPSNGMDTFNLWTGVCMAVATVSLIMTVVITIYRFRDGGDNAVKASVEMQVGK